MRSTSPSRMRSRTRATSSSTTTGAFGREPFGDAIGPIKDRGELTGVIIHKGVLVAEWGEPQRVDMTHSVTKSLLSSVAGVAYDGGMIRNRGLLARRGNETCRHRALS